jgi:hypothetical protein
MKTIKDLVELNDAHSIQLCATPDFIHTGKRTIHSVISSFKYAIRLVSDTKDDLFIYTYKDVDLQQVMNMPVDIDRRYNLLVTQDV